MEPAEGGGVRPAGPGWFHANVADLAWEGNGRHSYAVLEGAERWTQFGFSVDELAPGAATMYHREHHEDETFLVLGGEIDAVVEGQRLALRPGDVLHCSAGTRHAFVNVGAGPARLVMSGARGQAGGRGCDYVLDPVAAELGMCSPVETSESEVAYAEWPDYAPTEPRPWRTETADARAGDPVSAGSREEGWFVRNLRDAVWVRSGRRMTAHLDPLAEFEQYGWNVRVAAPGAPTTCYHREYCADELLLVLGGRGLLIVEGQERPLVPGDVVWFPAGTAHTMVAAPDEHLAHLMLGTRGVDPPDAFGEYVPEPLAARHGAAVAEFTTDPDVAYAADPEWDRVDAAWGLGDPWPNVLG